MKDHVSINCLPTSLPHPIWTRRQDEIDHSQWVWPVLLGLKMNFFSGTIYQDPACCSFWHPPLHLWGFPGGSVVKTPPAMWETMVWSLGWEDPLEKGMNGYPLQYSHLENFMDYNLQASSVHGVFQARVLEGVAIAFSRGSSQPRDRTQVSCIASRFLTVWVIREAPHCN